MSEIDQWSRETQEMTRSMLSDLSFGFRGAELFLKHRVLGAATMQVADAVTGEWLLSEVESGTTHRFASVDDLVAAGWALD